MHEKEDRKMIATLYLQTAAVAVIGTLLTVIIGRLVHGKCVDEIEECRINLDEIED